LARPPNFRQDKKRREEAQKKRNEAKQQERASRKRGELDPQTTTVIPDTPSRST
jgi:hypothetical protein